MGEMVVEVRQRAGSAGGDLLAWALRTGRFASVAGPPVVMLVVVTLSARRAPMS